MNRSEKLAASATGYFGEERRKYSEDGKYRYLSCQRIGSSDSRLLFIMLNPASTVETLNNPDRHRQTRTLCINFACRWGFGLLEVVNLFALEARCPKLLREADGPVGPDNDLWIRNAVERADKVVMAWGRDGSYMHRSAEVLRMILPIKVPYYLMKTKGGEPRHPIGIPKDCNPIPWE